MHFSEHATIELPIYPYDRQILFTAKFSDPTYTDLAVNEYPYAPPFLTSSDK
jgi:hypothetical protein